MNCQNKEIVPHLEAAKQKLKVAAQSNPRNYKIPLLIGLVEILKWKASSDFPVLKSARGFLEKALEIAREERFDEANVRFALGGMCVEEQDFYNAIDHYMSCLNPTLALHLYKESYPL